MKLTSLFLLVGALALSAVCPAAKPNILIIYVDDMGYMPNSYGGDLLSTPHMDAIAASGMRFTDGYVAAPVCGPSRVGLMTGRYQARSGHDMNSRKPGCELVLSETTMAQRLKALGYHTGLVGKWHLGSTTPEFMPNARGFDFFIGHEGNINEGEDLYYRNTTPLGTIPEHPITSPRWAREASAYIEENKEHPFFLYLAFHAVHTPHVADPATLKEFEHIKTEKLRNYAGLTREVDNAIGTVMAKLKALKLTGNTLVFLISDNGKAFDPAYPHDGLRGRKWYVFEGGVRVPFAMSWPGKIPAGTVSSVPVIQLDVLPTAIAAAGAEVDPAWNLDGKNLLPLAEQKLTELPRPLFWRFGTQYAIRDGKWKLVHALATQDKPMLIDLDKDRAETTDLTAQYPKIAARLQGEYDAWNATMQPPRWQDPRTMRDDEGVYRGKAKP